MADNSGTFLTFPTFILPVDDSSDCIISSQLIDHPALCRLVHYSEHENYSTSAVSDGTHNQTGRRPVCISKSVAPLPVNLPSGMLAHNISSPTKTTTLQQVPATSVLPPTDPVVSIGLSPLSLSTGNLPTTSSQQSTALQTLSPECIAQVAEMCTLSLQSDGIISQKLVNTLIRQGLICPSNTSSSRLPSSTTPMDRPEILPCDKVPSATLYRRHITIPQLHRYLGFCTLKNWKILSEVGQDTIDIINDGDIPLELGNVANIKISRRNKEPIPRPPNYLDVVHMDIGYGDCKSVGGSRYVLLLVDRAT